jgi:hypothetical protein
VTGSGLLAVGQQLQLTVQATGRQTRSVVDEIGDTAQDELLIREPVDIDGPGGPDVATGAALKLVWCSPVGWHEVPATFTGLARDRVRLWRVQPDGLVTTTQQREFTRAGDALRATVRQDGHAWGTVIVDLSEGGARCVFETATRPPSDVSVLLDIEIDGQVLLLPARVLASHPLSDQRWEVRLAFESIGRSADSLRRRVLAQQRRARSALR